MTATVPDVLLTVPLEARMPDTTRPEIACPGVTLTFDVSGRADPVA